MKVLGIDFTSAPKSGKPITCAVCEFENGALVASGLRQLPTFDNFEALLREDGHWIAGIDFPFSQPRLLVEALGWPQDWPGLVHHVDSMGKSGFEDEIKKYRDGQARGCKHLRRRTDVAADSRSPMTLYGTPVGKMFFQGAPRLARSGASILPCRPTESDGIVVEAYPALVVRKAVGRRSYKAEQRKKQSAEHQAARAAIARAVCGRVVESHYGLRVSLSRGIRKRCVEDPTGDSLDAVLCALQAAWAYTQRDFGFGMPADCDPLEGWIVDPSTLPSGGDRQPPR